MAFPKAALTILEDVNNTHGTTTAQLVGPARQRHISHARWDAWTRLYERARPNGQPAYSKTRIGDLFGVDHSSVVHGIRRWREMREAAE